MIELHLPAVHLADPLNVVLRQMRLMNVSGAICLDEEPWLVFVRDVVLTIRRNPNATVGSIDIRTPLLDPDALQITGRLGVASSDAKIFRVESGRVFGETQWAPLRFPMEVYSVVINSPDLQNALTSSPRDCFCNKSGERVPGGKDGAPCPNKDGGIVRCA
jgi:hypothetical protein